jgi:hypothetical protein
MSDTTALSHLYATHSQFVEQLNSWIGAVKRRRAGVPDPATAGESETAEARARLGAVLEQVLTRLSPERPGGHAGTEVPDEVIGRIEAEHRGDREWYVQDLEALRDAIRNDGPLDDRAIKVLDEIGDAADAAASASFRRLWRR